MPGPEDHALRDPGLNAALPLSVSSQRAIELDKVSWTEFEATYQTKETKSEITGKRC